MFTNTGLQFTLKNTIKGRKTVIVIRTDVSRENDEMVLSYHDNTIKSKIENDNKNRWRNTVFEIEEGTITEYNPQFVIEATKNKQSIGTIFVYQLL
ncbi:MAG: hypothetical protein K6E51_02835 [Treponema sp.]|nr:hypothetical protein [Treponema sp.]